MTVAIRIIRASAPSDANLRAVEREEQILAIAKRVTEASGIASQQKINECAAKLRAAATMSANSTRTPDQLANDVKSRLTASATSNNVLTHGELDLDRVMALLEG